MNKSNKIPTPTVGEILREEFLEPYEITAYRLAKEINVSTTTVLDIINNNRKITVDTALRLSRYFGNSAHFWLNLQNDIDIRNQQVKIASDIKKITPLSKDTGESNYTSAV
jgi:addiction module HigA family antidote